jgi:hypothetical protein
MTEHVRIYAGTERGVSVWREGSSGWQEVGEGIPKEPCRALAGSPTRPERVFVGVEHDGIYGTEDAGESWTPLFKDDVWSIAVDPTDERVIYAGTAPVHLFRSEDAGSTWKELTALQELPPHIRARQIYPGVGEESHILSIFIDPKNADNIVLSLEHGGVIRSRDRGRSFEDVTVGIDYVDIHQVARLPGHERYVASTARGLYATSDLAAGWKRAENGFYRDYFYKFIVLPPRAEGPGNPTILLSTGDHSPGSWNRRDGARGAIYRSVDCAESWHRVGVGAGLPLEMRERAWMFVPHPHNEDGAFAALGRYPYPNVDTGAGTIALTRDRGESWEALSDIHIRSAWGVWATAD